MPIALYAVAHRINDMQDRFLRQLKENTFEKYVFVVADNSDDGAVTKHLEGLSKKYGIEIHTIVNKQNLGLGIAMNQAQRHAFDVADEYVYKIDWDTFLSPDWTKKLRRYIELHPSIGMVGSSTVGGHQIVRKVNDEEFVELDLLLGHCLCIPKKTIIHMQNFYEVPHTIYMTSNQYRNFSGGFHDPNYFYGVEDFDYSLAVRFSGLRIVTARDVNIIHEDYSKDDDWAKKRHQYVWNAFDYYRQKWSRILNFWGHNTTRGWEDMWDCLPMNVGHRMDALMWLKELQSDFYNLELKNMKESKNWLAYKEALDARGIKYE